MAMTPQEKEMFDELKAKVVSLETARNVDFLENLSRLLVDEKISSIRLADLADINTATVTNGQVIKYNSSSDTWVNADDIIGA